MLIYIIRQNDGIIGLYKNVEDAVKILEEHNKVCEKWAKYYLRQMELN